MPPLPPILVINLSDRRDRWEQVQKDFKSWPITLERMDAVRRSPGWKGCALSQRTCIQIAKERRYPWVLYIEDDVYPTEDGLAQFQQLLPILWNSRDKWDIFNGGFSTVHEAKVLSTDPPLFRAKGWGAQFCLIHAAAYDTLIQGIGEEPQKECDNYFSEDGVRMWCTYPHLTLQHPGKSDNEQTDVNHLYAYHKGNVKLAEALHYSQLAVTATAAALVICALYMVLRR